jgi:hypothetical protein
MFFKAQNKIMIFQIWVKLINCLLPLPNELILQHNCHNLSLRLTTKVEMLQEMGPVAMLEHKMRVTCLHMRWEAYWKQGEACLRLLR